MFDRIHYAGDQWASAHVIKSSAGPILLDTPEERGAKKWEEKAPTGALASGWHKRVFRRASVTVYDQPAMVFY